MRINNDLSLVSRSLRYKLRVAFCLIFILPLLIFLYLISQYIVMQAQVNAYIGLLVIIYILISIGGFWVVKEIIERVINMSLTARLIANGNLNHRIDITSKDEVGELAKTMNQLSGRIANNMEELRNYGKKTTEINLQIQKRVLALSGILQVSSLVAQRARLDDILNLIIEKCRLAEDSDVAYLFLKEPTTNMLATKLVNGINSDYLLRLKLDLDKCIFTNAIKSHTLFVLDSDNPLADNLRLQFYEQFRLKNTLAVPMYSKGAIAGILGIGNTRDKFSYEKSSLESMDIFAKQLTISLENDKLAQRIEKLEIRDALTGLYNASFIKDRLQEEIRRAILYQRPCSFILLNVDNFNQYRERFGVLAAETTLKRVAALIDKSVSEVDRVGRFGDNEFAVLLPERNKRQATDGAQDIRNKIESTFEEEPDPNRRITVSSGVSENPLDGQDAEEIIKKAKDGLASDKKKKQYQE